MRINLYHSVKTIILVSLLSLSINSRVAAFEFPEKKDSKTFIKELNDNLKKVDSAIEAVKNRLKTLDENTNRPDLLMQEAELHIEKSRYHYFIAREKSPDSIKSFKDVEQSMAEKELAIGVYQKIIDEFPNNFNIDKIMFFMAQEMQQIDATDAAMEQYKKLVSQHPNSEFKDDALIILGNKAFDERDFATATDYYIQILDMPEGPMHNVARYKLAWSEVNQENCDKALKLFETVARNAKEEDAELKKISATGNIQREALVDSVLCYTKVRKKDLPETTIAWYKELSDSNHTYITVLDKLANRYYIQKQNKKAIPIYRELIRRSYDLETKIDYIQRLFGNLRQYGYTGPIDEDAKILVDTLRRYFYSWRQEKSDRLEVAKNLEKYLRDAATRLHAYARKENDPDITLKAANTYKYYLMAFGRHPNALKMKYNSAESLYEAKQYLKAAEEYRELAKQARRPREQADLYHSSVVSYLEALKMKDDLSKLELVQARSGFLRSSEAYLRLNPRSKKALDIRYAMGKVYFDQNDWDQTIDYFWKFVFQYPNTSKTVDAITLILESYHLKDDKDGMVKAGNQLIQSRRFNGRIVAEIRDMVSRAEFKRLEERYASNPGGSNQDLAAGFFKLSAKYKGTEAGEKAVYNAYVSAKKTNQPDQMMAAAEMLMQDYPKSKYLEDILPNMSQTMFNVGLFDLGAKASEIYASNFKGKEASVDLLLNSAKIRSALNNHLKAYENFNLALNLAKSRDQQISIMQTAAETFDEYEKWSFLEKQAKRWLQVQKNSSKAYYYLAKSSFKRKQFSSGFAYAKRAKQYIANAGSDRAFVLSQITLLETQPIFKKYNAITMNSGGSEEQLIAQKTQLLELLSQKYTQIAQSGESTASIAALAQSGHLYKDFSKFLSQTKIPGGLTAAQKAQYRTIMRNKINEVQQSALGLYQACHKKAEQIKLFTHEALECSKKQLLPRQGQQLRSSMRNFKGQLQNNVKTLMKNPKDIQTLHKNAKMYLDNRWNYSSLLTLSRAKEIDANNSTTYDLLGKTLENLNRDDEAYKNYRQALRYDASNRSAASHVRTLCRKYSYASCSR
ncbi:MAG TPA: hypothetical protein PKC21_01465 [Oligoflexia bacterium]|nr:hypothetical protein [Oligoflexia bacterium]HMR23999.1 hypothetical protein [Oligoflexia bacterium]